MRAVSNRLIRFAESRQYYSVKDFFGIFKIWQILKIRKYPEKYNVEDIINFAYNWADGLIRPFQDKNEISKLCNIVYEIKPLVVLEIGTANGGTLFLFCCIAAENAKIISLDLPVSNSIFRIPIYKSFCSKNQCMHLIRNDSHKKETLTKVKNILRGEKIDFLFIDGDHTYEGVKEDFKMYGPLVKTNGLIAFHDITNLVPGCDVMRFWNEIKKDYEIIEILNDNKYGGIGIIINR